MTKIVGNNDGPGGRNETYKIGNRPNVSRREAVREVEQGKHPGAHVVEIEGERYVRDNPDHSERDNVNRNKWGCESKDGFSSDFFGPTDMEDGPENKWQIFREAKAGTVNSTIAALIPCAIGVISATTEDEQYRCSVEVYPYPCVIEMRELHYDRLALSPKGIFLSRLPHRFPSQTFPSLTL